MSKFNDVRIGELGNIVTGKTPKTNIKENYGTDYMFVGPTDLHKHFIISDSVKMISELGFNSIKNNTISGLSILVGCIGWDMGNVALVKGKCATNQQINSITNIRKEYSPYYIYYWFKGKKDYLFQISNVTRTPMLNKSDFSNININIPNLQTQKSIAKVLSDLDSKIAINNKINQELEAMAKTLYDYWFVQFDFPDKNGKPYKSSEGKMIFNEELKREIPVGWEVEELGSCIKIFDSLRIPMSRSEREKVKGDIPYYGATSIMGYVKDFIFNDEYILLAEDGSVMNEKGMPIVQFIWGKTWVNNHAHVIQANNKLHNEFIYQLVKMIPVVLIKTGSIQMKINQTNLNKYKVIAPPFKLVNEFSNQAIKIRKQLINNKKQNQKLSELRDWLLPMLMNGQVRVGE
ncbi:restriction endonuclease subunit S [Tenacibaculum finnmarkense]|uniref:restriction endonuclease subunit S n=1 Tax=Tenacibaculum finnmarkense TaxID=2781243 RepID=UPI00187B5037|nr:restriction endonuclease subunit S [Tenacibaculum finnmarkense]MBE7661006.1 restriction endonuclease subunit S [Tenacibaculum finnmarkense genomovar finnmarkense]MCG8252578.1 restriction endonuclease subunit S [Tenacibaculum finnmarkense genomovar finnmarkense]MCG8816032.1 restriction endonuclease subunit S [Tenacibaculum finnmarkense]MCG8821314.1 restriction endonuclease subunit S [Tenacibaculum finnmarkense]